MTTLETLLKQVEELNANTEQPFDIDLGRIDILVDEFERNGKFKNHEKVDNFLKRLKLAEAAPIFVEVIRKLVKQRDRAINGFYKQEILRSECESQMNYELNAIVAKRLKGGK